MRGAARRPARPCMVPAARGECFLRPGHDVERTTTVARVIDGVVARFAATTPMTLAMELLHRRLPRGHRWSLPPREITMNLARATGLRRFLGEPARQQAALLSHFGYGAAAGAVFEALASRLGQSRLGLRASTLMGVAFELAVWAVSYLGFLPAAGLYRPATREPAPRNLLMIAAHVIWDATLGALAQAMEPRQGQRAADDGPAVTARAPGRGVAARQSPRGGGRRR